MQTRKKGGDIMQHTNHRGMLRNYIARMLIWRVLLLGLILSTGLVAYQSVSSPSILTITRTLYKDGKTDPTQERTLYFSPYVHTLFMRLQPFLAKGPPLKLRYVTSPPDLCSSPNVISYTASFTMPVSAPVGYGEFAPEYSFSTCGDKGKFSDLDRAFTVWDIPFLTL
jgi:hypothetical protein